MSKLTIAAVYAHPDNYQEMFREAAGAPPDDPEIG